MVLMKVVDAGVLQRMLAASLGQQAPSVDPTGPPPPAAASAVPPQARNPPMQVPTPPPQAPSAYYSQGPPPPAASAPAPAAAPAIDTQTQAALLQQVMAMSQAQIDALPPKDRATVMQLRTQLQSMGR